MLPFVPLFAYVHTFQVGVDHEGRVIALHLVTYANAGWSLDFSEMVTGFRSRSTSRSMHLSLQYLQHHLHNIDHCYNIPHIQADGYICRTNLPSSTAMRGFGKVEAHYVIEEIMERVARRLGMPSDKVWHQNSALGHS